MLQLAVGQEKAPAKPEVPCCLTTCKHAVAAQQSMLKSASQAAGSNHSSPAPPQGERLYYTVKRSPGGQVGEEKHATWSSNCTVRIASGWLVISRWLAVIA